MSFNLIATVNIYPMSMSHNISSVFDCNSPEFSICIYCNRGRNRSSNVPAWTARPRCSLVTCQGRNYPSSESIDSFNVSMTTCSCSCQILVRIISNYVQFCYYGSIK